MTNPINRDQFRISEQLIRDLEHLSQGNRIVWDGKKKKVLAHFDNGLWGQIKAAFYAFFRGGKVGRSWEGVKKVALENCLEEIQKLGGASGILGEKIDAMSLGELREEREKLKRAIKGLEVLSIKTSIVAGKILPSPKGLQSSIEQLEGWEKVVSDRCEALERDDRQFKEEEETSASLDIPALTIPEENKKVLGQGAVNKVYLITYKEEGTGKQQEKVFKPDPAGLGWGIKLKEKMFGTAAASGIPVGSEAHLTARSVAASETDKMLFKDHTVSVATSYVIVNGERGILMDKAKGKSPKPKQEIQEKVDISSRKNFQKMISHAQEDKRELDATLGLIAASLHYRKVELTPEGLIGTRVEIAGFDPKNANTLEGLLRLQILDIVTGQVDRHPENYFIDDEGNVTGIDQDCSFGKDALPRDVDVRKQESIKFGFVPVVPNKGSLMPRMPPAITKEMQQDINELYKRKEEYEDLLNLYLVKEEVDATLDRLERLHQHVNTPDNCHIVESKEQLEKVVALFDANNSYIGREIHVFKDGENGWNYLREYQAVQF